MVKTSKEKVNDEIVLTLTDRRIPMFSKEKILVKYFFVNIILNGFQNRQFSASSDQTLLCTEMENIVLIFPNS